MKSKNMTSAKSLLLAICTATVITIISWSPLAPSPLTSMFFATDTVPANDDLNISKLNKALAKLDKAALEIDDNISKHVDLAMQKINFDQAEAEVNEAIRNVRATLQNVDMDKMKIDVRHALAKIDMNRVKQDLAQATAKFDEIKPQLEKCMADAKKQIATAKNEIEKTKLELKNYNQLIDALHKDELLNKYDDYNINHKNHQLFINGKLIAQDIYNKYEALLKKHAQFSLHKTNDGLKISNE